MEKVKITPGKLCGKITIPSSKSVAHRLIISAALGKTPVKISNVYLNQDIKATIGAMRNMGAEFNFLSQTELLVTPINRGASKDVFIDANQSGSTLRFLIPVALALFDRAKFTGSKRLLERPLDEYFKIFNRIKIKYQKKEDVLEFENRLKSGEYVINGDVSSQYVTGLLFSLPLISGDSTLKINPPVNSIGYINITLDVLKKSGIEIKETEPYCYFINGNQSYNLSDCYVEGDYSQAAFFLIASALGSHVDCGGLNLNSYQGDMEILDVLRRFGCEVTTKAGESGVQINVKAKKLVGIDLDASQIPDLVPIISVLACAAKGKTVIYGAERLKTKESDRLAAVSGELYKLGADIKQTQDGLIINGTGSLLGGTAYSHDDHRIAMSLSIASLICKQNVIIEDSRCIDKSFPTFYKEFIRLGGNLEEIKEG